MDIIGPSIALSRVCYLSGCILRRFDLLTLTSLLTAVACWYSDFPHDGCMSPSRLTDLHGAYLFRHPRPLLDAASRAGGVRNGCLHHTRRLFTAQSFGTRTGALRRSKPRYRLR